MPHDVDSVPSEGWMFWVAVAVAAGVLTGAAVVRGAVWIVVVGALAVAGALNQMITEVRRDRAVAARRAVRRDRLR